jgi:aryl-alcohol dehydrogenase (NADP+)
MDTDGIDIALLMPSQGLVLGSVRNPRLAAGMARAYNNWVAEYCAACPQRLLATALLPVQDVAAAVAELRRTVGELGACAAYMRPNPVAGRTLADPCYIPLYAEIEELGIPLLIHEGCGFAPGATIGIDRYENGLFSHVMSHTFEQMAALLTIVCGGVLERFPDLKVAFLESGCSWVPYWLERLDEHFRLLPHEVPWMKLLPSEYFRRQCAVTFEGSEQLLPNVMDVLGAERLLYASDYPHSDAPFPSVAPIRERKDVPADALPLLLGGNAARLLGRRLGGSTGLAVSRLCLGCMPFGKSRQVPWFLNETESRAVIRTSLDLGINFFDTADMYSLGESEEVVGAALRSLVGRDEVVLATKVGMPMGRSPSQRGLSRKHIFEGVDQSLRRLGMDYVDLLIAHEWDNSTPIEETLVAFDDVVRSGKALYSGASGMCAWQFAKALFLADRHGWVRFVSVQNHYNLVRREDERELIPLCIDQGVAVTPFSPLARGLLSGNRVDGPAGLSRRAYTDKRAYRLYGSRADLAMADRVRTEADRCGLRPAQVALAWVLGRPGVSSVVVGATSPSQISELASGVDVVLEPHIGECLEKLYQPQPLVFQPS